MGKRQLGQMQPFELVLTLIVADLATIPMVESSVPILHGIVPLLTLVSLHYFLTIITRKSDALNKLVSGKPVIVINPKGIDYSALKKLNISLDDLFETIRSCGSFSLDEVQYAIVETNGKVNVLTKKDFTPLAIGNAMISDGKNIKLKALEKIDENTIPITLISEGSMLKNNVKIAKLEEKDILNLLKRVKTKKIKDVLVLTIDGNGKVYFQTKKGTYKVFNINYSQEIV